jgi:hypothetical protein
MSLSYEHIEHITNFIYNYEGSKYFNLTWFIWKLYPNKILKCTLYLKFLGWIWFGSSLTFAKWFVRPSILEITTN